MNNFTTNTYELKREICNFSEKILIFKVIATNTKSVAISLTQVCCNKFDTIH